MDPTPVTLDEVTAAKLAAAANGHPVPLLNPAGEVVAYGFTPALLAKAGERPAVLAAFDRLYPPAEVARLRERAGADPRPRVPHDEVLRWVEAQ